MTHRSFGGFQAPFYTMVPNELLDDLMVDLTGAELKVALYVCRRTFGFGKLEDGISLSQLHTGVTRKDGQQLDRGCGVRSKTRIVLTLKALVERNILVAVRQQSPQHGFEPTVYRLNVVGTASGTPLVPKTSTRGASPKTGTRLVPETSTRVVPKTGTRLVPETSTRLVPEPVPTKERASKESFKRKHHHPSAAVSDAVSVGLAGDDDARETGLTGGGPVDAVVERMVALGLSPRLAAEVATQHPPERIAQVLDRLPHRQARNPVGYFIAELRAGDFAAPPAVAKGERQVAKARALQARLETGQAAEAAIASRVQAVLEGLPEAEKAALWAEARLRVARQSQRAVEDVPDDSPWVLGTFENLVAARDGRAG